MDTMYNCNEWMSLEEVIELSIRPCCEQMANHIKRQLDNPWVNRMWWVALLRGGKDVHCCFCGKKIN